MSTISEAVSEFVTNAVGWRGYHNGESEVYLFLGDYHDMDLKKKTPEPASSATQVAELHSKGKSLL
jgi:hypothetical protein